MSDTRNTQEQDYIIDRIGAENWEHVVAEFGGYTTVFRILQKLDDMFPHEESKANHDFAKLIYAEVHK